MSYRKIFSVVTEHTVSTVIARYAISMAAACGAELVLYAAHAGDSTEATRQYTESHAEHILTAAAALGVSVSRITENGDSGSLLPERVNVEKADLVFYPLMPYTRFGVNLQRHTVRHLLRKIPVDLAVVRTVSMAKPHPGNILVPLDRIVSDKEHRSMFVADLAGSFDSPVTLYHLSDEPGAGEMSDDIILVRNRLEQRHIRVIERSGRGDLGTSVRAEAITRRNDLIVLGASRRGLVRRTIFGNPAWDIMKQPPCNAILFRAAE
jgi:nucleotide-binding universal stress UspA family protein